MNRLIRSARRRIVTGEECGDRFAALQNRFGCEISEILAFARIEFVDAGRQTCFLHRAAVAFVTTLKPGHLKIADVPDVAMAEREKVSRYFVSAFDIIKIN